MSSVAQCSVCRSPERAELERILATGQHSVRAVAREHGISRDALRRHVMRHVPGNERVLYEAVEGASALDIAQALLDAAQHAQDVRDDADARGDDRTALAADKAIIAARITLADRLGMRTSEARRELADADAMITATLAVSTDYPSVSKLLALQLRKQGDVALARVVSDRSDRDRAALTASTTPEEIPA
jgi:transposase-like protein